MQLRCLLRGLLALNLAACAVRRSSDDRDTGADRGATTTSGTQPPSRWDGGPAKPPPFPDAELDGDQPPEMPDGDPSPPTGSSAGKCPASQLADCLGICGGGAVLDDCNVCDGKNASKDCAGTCGGSAMVDCAGTCNGPKKPASYYRDDDGDDLGDPQAALASCTKPVGYVQNGDDCDPKRKAICTPTDTLCFKHKISGSASLPWNQNTLVGLGDVDGDRVPDLAAGDRIVFLNADASVKGSRRIVGADLGVSDLLPTFGAGVAGMGDLDGNGVPDLAIAEAPTWTSTFSGATNLARLWLLFLDRSGAPIKRALVPQPAATRPDACIAGTSNEVVVTWAGNLASFDAQHDGKLELAAGTTEDCSGSHVTGRVELIKIEAGPATSVLNRVGYDQAPYGDDEFRNAILLSAGDANGDGAGDLSVLTSTGKLWTLLLSSAGALVGTARISTTDTRDALLVGMNRGYGPLPWLGDGAPARVLVSLPNLTARGGFMAARPASAQGPQTYRLYYPKELNVEAHVAAGDNFGQAGASLGDLEGDGLPEILVSAPGDDAGGTDLGAAYILGFAADCSNQTLRGDCNARAADGCETALVTAENCGACGRSCSGAPNSTAFACTSNGTCALTCAENFGDCNDDVRDGCETDLRSSVDHCGKCATTCRSGNHLVPVCNAGTCGLGTACEPLWNDCNANTADGCEACGTCGQETFVPAPASGYPPAAPCTGRDEVCQQQFYTYGGNVRPYARCMMQCPLGRGDCNGDASDGCEANLTLQTQCGSCAAACGIWSFLDYCVLNDTGTGYQCR